MTNPVFSKAQETLAGVFSQIEFEIARLAGLFDRNDALEAQNRQLQEANAERAKQLAETHAELARAKSQADDIIGAAIREKDRLIAEARSEAARLKSECAPALAYKAEFDSLMARFQAAAKG